MPKPALMNDPAVVELVNKRVAVAETKAQKDLMRSYKAVARAVKEAIGTCGLDRKIAKSVTEHVSQAIASLAPGAQAAE